MSATGALKEDHRVIEKVVKVLAGSVEKLRSNSAVSAEILEKALDFIKTFADRFHHGKEETVLFPTLEAKGIPKNGGPIAVMLQEHEMGRGFIRNLAEAVNSYKSGDSSAKQSIMENAQGYAQLLTDHIWKEENILFRFADEVLSEADHSQLLQHFDRVEKETIGGKRSEYVDLVAQLSGTVEEAP